jgi:NAD(P)-dependent dehydrogenase (short-subunit alcohol dehydrogenase family)
MSTYILAGASSAIAKATALQLMDQGHRVIGISRSEVEGLSDFHQVNAYDFGAFPAIDEPCVFSRNHQSKTLSSPYAG